MASGKNALLKRAKEAIEASEWAAALEAAQVRRAPYSRQGWAWAWAWAPRGRGGGRSAWPGSDAAGMGMGMGSGMAVMQQWQ